MRRFSFAIILLSLSGCAHQTIHEYCTEKASRYASYDQCYAEEQANPQRNKGRRATAAFFQGFGQGMNQNRSVSCTSTNYGYTVQTNCQ